MYVFSRGPVGLDNVSTKLVFFKLKDNPVICIIFFGRESTKWS
jgi:hypothetical protein